MSNDEIKLDDSAVELLKDTVGGGTTVKANPELVGDEPNLEGLEVEGIKYKVPEGGGSSVVPEYFISAQVLNEFAYIVDQDGKETTINMSKLKTLLLNKGIITDNQIVDGNTPFGLEFNLISPNITFESSSYGSGTEVSKIYITISTSSNFGVYNINILYDDVSSGSETIYTKNLTFATWNEKVVDVLDAIQNDEEYKFIINGRVFIQYLYCYKFAPIFFSMEFASGAIRVPTNTTEFLSMLDITEIE